MKIKKILFLLIFLILGLVLFIPNNVNAENSDVTFKIRYTVEEPTQGKVPAKTATVESGSYTGTVNISWYSSTDLKDWVPMSGDTFEDKYFYSPYIELTQDELDTLLSYQDNSVGGSIIYYLNDEIYFFESHNVYFFVGTYKLIDDASNIDIEGKSEFLPGEDYIATLRPLNGYKLLPEDIRIYVDNFGDLVQGEDFEYNSETGKVTVFADNVLGDITIDAIATRIEEITEKIYIKGKKPEVGGLPKDIDITIIDNENLSVEEIEWYEVLEDGSYVPKEVDSKFEAGKHYSVCILFNTTLTEYPDHFISVWDNEEIEMELYYYGKNVPRKYEAQYDFSDLDEYSYRFNKGELQKFVLNNVNEYSFEIDGNSKLFSKLTISNLNLVKDVDYTVANKNTIISFTETGLTKLNILAVGTYDVVVEYTNNKKVTGKLIIEADKISEDNKNDNTDNANTGNANNTNVGTTNTNASNVNTNKPTGNNPQTGDDIVLFTLISVIAVVGLAITIKVKKFVK